MGLVDDERSVLGKDGSAAPYVGAEKVEVDDDDIGDAGPSAGPLGEAVGAGGTTMGARSLVSGDADR